MHGLNVRQRSAFILPITANNDNGQAQLTQQLYYVNDVAVALRNNIPEINADDQNQIYMKRSYTRIYINNCSQFPCYLHVAWVTARRDVSTSEPTFPEYQAVDAPAANLPYFSGFTSSDWQRTFKITRSKHMMFYPMKPKVFTIKSQYAGRNRPINGLVEGDTNYQFRKGTQILVMRFTGVPFGYRDAALPNIQSTSLGPLQVRGLRADYYSYYLLNDVQPDSSFSATIPTSIGPTNQNTQLNPTYLNTAFNNSAWTSNDYLFPNTVDSETAP